MKTFAHYEEAIRKAMEKNLAPKTDRSLNCLCSKCKRLTSQTFKHSGFKSPYEGEQLCELCISDEMRAEAIEFREKYNEHDLS